MKTETWPKGVELVFYRVTVSKSSIDHVRAEATVKIRTAKEEILEASEGNGPINALDRAFRNALRKVLENLSRLDEIRLTDFSVSVVDGQKGTESEVKVIITFTDGKEIWQTQGVSENIIDASWEALAEGIFQGLSI